MRKIGTSTQPQGSRNTQEPRVIADEPMDEDYEMPHQELKK